MFNIAYWGNAWIVDMENMIIFDLIFDKKNHGFHGILESLKVVIYLVLYYLGIDRKPFWTKN